MGRVNPKTRPRLLIETQLSRRKLQGVLRKAPAHAIQLKNFAVLGENQRLICANLLKLLDRFEIVKVMSPGLMLGKQTAALIRGVMEAEKVATERRKAISRLVTTLTYGTDYARRPLATRELIERVTTMRVAEKKSIRRISSETGVSRSTVLRIIRNQKALAGGGHK